MRKLIGTTIVAALAALFVATFAVAQPGIGVTKIFPLVGRGSVPDPFRIDPCPNGQTYVSNGTTWSCAVAAAQTYTAGDGLDLTGSDFDLNIAGATCGPGEFMSSLGATGTGICSAVSLSTYTAGDGLTVTANDFDLIFTSDFQITADQLDMSTTVTLPGSLSVATTSTCTGLVTATAGVTTPANLTTTGTGDLVSADDLTVADDATITGDLHGIGGVDFDTTLNVDGASALVGLVTATAGVTSPANLTTTGGGDVVSGDALTVAGDSILGNAQGDTTSIWSHVMYYGTVPVLTGCTAACSIASYSTDERGKVLCTDGPNACTVTFVTGYDTNPPVCGFTSTSTAVVRQTSAPTTALFTFTTTTAGVHSIDYICDGMK